jgi:Family of unknown function (DUF6463)
MDPNRATLWAGRSLTVIGIGHMTLLLPPALRDGSARRWLAGDLRSADGQAGGRTALRFWEGPGSLGVPLAVVGALVVRLARAGVPVPRSATAVLAAWGAFGAAVLEPSGYPLAVVPVGLLVSAERRRLRHDASSWKPPTSPTS